MSGAHSPRQKENKGVFGPAGLAPTVKVTSPTGNYIVTAGPGSPSTVTVSATATATDKSYAGSPLGSPLPGSTGPGSPNVSDVSASLQWVSDKDGVVGTGASPTLTLTTVGQHIITVTATAEVPGSPEGSPVEYATGSAKLYVYVVAG